MVFFAYRRYDKTAADNLLYKIKNLSFSKSKYTTTITDANGSETGTLSDSSGGLVEKITDTLADKTLSGDIMTTSSSSQGVVVDGLTGKVIINTGPIETISAQPKPSPHTTPSSATPTLSEEDKRQAEEFSQLFSQ